MKRILALSTIFCLLLAFTTGCNKEEKTVPEVVPEEEELKAAEETVTGFLDAYLSGNEDCDGFFTKTGKETFDKRLKEDQDAYIKMWTDINFNVPSLEDYAKKALDTARNYTTIKQTESKKANDIITVTVTGSQPDLNMTLNKITSAAGLPNGGFSQNIVEFFDMSVDEFNEKYGDNAKQTYDEALLKNIFANYDKVCEAADKKSKTWVFTLVKENGKWLICDYYRES